MVETEPILEEVEVLEPQKRPKTWRIPPFLLTWPGRIFLIVGLGTIAFFGLAYAKYAFMIQEALEQGPFANTLNVFAAPNSLAIGDRISTSRLVEQLRRAGYTESERGRMGWYHIRPSAVAIFPGRDSLFQQQAFVVSVDNGRVKKIQSLNDNTELQTVQLEPQLITNLSEENREKRRLVSFNDLPPILVKAVLAAEDKRFFKHTGLDLRRIVKAAWVNLRDGRKQQGASTLTMQLARSLWLDRDKNWKRKIEETLIATHLEATLSKQQIFEHYANQVYLGQRGSFGVLGFGQAALAFFGKDIAELNLPESATLAGLIQRPIYYNPLRFPERAKERRDVVLELMQQNGFISQAEYQHAVAEPLIVNRRSMDVLDTQYFLDMITGDQRAHLGDTDGDLRTRRIYTTLDAELQHDATEAVKIGMEQLDKLLAKRKGDRPQVALVALDPRTGDVKALIGGRNYGVSQLNHALAHRQPGSVFKPFVYAAALNTAFTGGPQVFTPASTVEDAPTRFLFDGKSYEPGNFGGGFGGRVTLRRALARSLNNATVRVAEMVGYQEVAGLARRAHLGDNIQATPSVALGSYEATPIDVAGAYTIFANQGVYVRPNFISAVRTDDGSLVNSHTPERQPVLNPQVAYLMVNMLEEVMRSGTAAGARSRGFLEPAAGKTGTSRDGWFAGFTSELVCVVWVGYDDNRDLKLEGSKSALPIWTEFMKRAHARRKARPLAPPKGIVSAQVDPSSGQLANSWCPESVREVFIAGTQPSGYCSLDHGSLQPVFSSFTTTGSETTVRPIPVRSEQLRP